MLSLRWYSEAPSDVARRLRHRHPECHRQHHRHRHHEDDPEHDDEDDDDDDADEVDGEGLGVSDDPVRGPLLPEAGRPPAALGGGAVPGIGPSDFFARTSWPGPSRYAATAA
jgi:hypothetical protein